MRAVTVLAVSAAAHAALLVALPAPGVRLHAPQAAVEIEIDSTPVPEPVAIDFITIPASASPSPSDSPPSRAPARARAPARSGSDSPSLSATGTLPPTETAAPGPYTGALAMRGAARDHAPELALSIPDSSAIAEILSRPSPPEVPSSGKLDENRDGTYTGRDLTFTAHFNADGSIASIDDKPNFNYKLHLPKPKKIARALKRHVSSWTEDPYGVATGMGNRTRSKTGHPGGPEDDDGDAKADDGETVTILSGGFDVTDALMRLAGDDPYAARKREMLEKTFDERVQIGTAYRADQLEKSDQTMLTHLDKLWARTDLGVAKKRRLIFELWDECAETGGSQLVAGGTKARAALVRFIRVHLPADSDDAYSADELRRLNGKRRSTATFEPYE
jgi:hypothetical protein